MAEISHQTARAAVPHFDLTRQYEQLGPELEAAVQNVIKGGRFILGPQVAQFEESFAQYVGTRFALGVGSGTDALIFSLKALGIRENDEVLVPALTFVGTVFAILHLKARPVFVEVDPQTYNLDPSALNKAVTSRSRAVIPVHLYGQATAVDVMEEIARKRKLKVIEDACQAHGAVWAKKKAGSWGDAGCFSFYPTKNLGGFGDGGMVVTNLASVAETIRRMRNAGRDSLGRYQELGWASRLDTIQAAVLSVKLKYLDSFNEKRRAIAARYHSLLSSTPLLLPNETPEARHVYHLYVVRVPNGKRDALAKYLQEKGIGTAIHYHTAVHRQPFFRKLHKKRLHLPVTEKLTGQILSLPMFPEMTEDEIERTTDTIRQFYA